MYLDLLCLRDNGISNSLFHIFMKTYLSVFKNTPRGKLHKASNYSDEIKMLKSIAGCRIKSFIPVENMNVKKLIDS